MGKKRIDFVYGREGFRNDILLIFESVFERYVRVLIVISELGVNNIIIWMVGYVKRKRYVYILFIFIGFWKFDNCYFLLILYLLFFWEFFNFFEN